MSYPFVFQELPVAAIKTALTGHEKDPSSFEEDRRLRRSIEKLGILQPLAVTTTVAGDHVLVDGHRRYWIAVRLRVPTVPCRIYSNLTSVEAERLRFELEDDRRVWQRHERRASLRRMLADKLSSTYEAVAALVFLKPDDVRTAFLSQWTPENVPKLLDQADVPEHFRVEIEKLVTVLHPVGNFDIPDIIETIFARVRHTIIASARDLALLRRIFAEASFPSEELENYLVDQDMTVRELSDRVPPKAATN